MATVPTMQDLARLALLNPSQREKLETDNASLDRGLKGLSMESADGEQMPMMADPRFPIPDPALLRESRRRNQQTLDKGTAPDYTGAQKNGLWAACQEWIKDYREGLPSSDQMERATWENIQLHMRHEDRNKHRGPAIKNARRVLYPEEEDFALESLRPANPTRTNYLALMEGHDRQVWTDAKDLERAMEALDDSQYAEFLRLRALGIETPKLIQRTAHLSQAQYEACVQRLQAEPRPTLAEEEDEGDTQIPTSQPAQRGRPRKHDGTPTVEDITRVCAYVDTLTEPFDLGTAAFALKLTKTMIATIMQARELETAAVEE